MIIQRVGTPKSDYKQKESWWGSDAEKTPILRVLSIGKSPILKSKSETKREETI